MNRKRKKKKKNFLVPIVIVVTILVFAGMVAYGWQSRKKQAAQNPSEETVEVNSSETTTAGEIQAVTDNETETDAETETSTETPTTPSPDDKIVYFTFDDGPWTGTPRLLDILDKYEIKACFFVTAQYMEGDKLVDMLAQIKNRGHNIGVHSLTHNYKQIYASVDAFLADYDAMDDIIFKATGERSKILRFPGGSNAGYNKAIRPQLLQAIRDRGIVYFDWNSFDGDVEGKKGQALIDQTIQQVNENNHSILLMHDMPSTSFVHDALPAIIEKLKADGYRFEMLDENTPPRQFAK